MQFSLFRVSLLLIVFGIILGAMGAHSLEEKLTADQLDSFKTGVSYQLYNGLGLLIITHMMSRFRKQAFRIGSNLILAGTLLFSISIYLLAAGGLEDSVKAILGPITPIGGSIMIIGWFVLAFGLQRKEHS